MRIPRSKRRGAALVEMAFVLPIALLFLLGIMEYGRYMMVRQVMEAASREGARYCAVRTNQTLVNIYNGDPSNLSVHPGLRAVVNQRLALTTKQMYDFTTPTNPWSANDGVMPLNTTVLNNANFRDKAGLCAYASDNAGNILVDANHPTGNVNEAQFTEFVGVQLNARFKPVLPKFVFFLATGTSTLPLRIRSQMFCEGN
jgi:hypothetical protein